MDPESLNPDTDPDPAFQINPDPGYGSGSNPDRMDDEKLKEKKIQQKI